KPTCQADGAHRRLRARTRHAHHLNGRHGTNDQFSQLRFKFGRSAKREAAAHRFVDCLNDSGMRVAQNEWTPRTDIVEVTIAINVVEIRSFPARNEQGMAAHGAKS